MNPDQELEALLRVPTDVIGGDPAGLIHGVNEALPGCLTAKLAAGSFLLSGLQPVADAAGEAKQIRLIITPPHSPLVLEDLVQSAPRLDEIGRQLEQARYVKRSRKLQLCHDTAMALRRELAHADPTDELQELGRRMLQWLDGERVKVRVHVRGPLHGRCYIFNHPSGANRPSSAIVGSTDLMLATVEDPTQLCVKSTGDENLEDLNAWFDGLWDSAVDFNDLLRREIEASWIVSLRTPWEVLMKAAYTFVRERLDDDEDQVLFETEIADALTDFQRAAVHQAIAMIHQNRGCFVADVVGLGKSYIGAAVLKHFERIENRRPLIVCSKSLEEMWQRYNERYALNAAVVPMSMISGEDRGVNLLEDYPLRDFVLIDESHSFRNHTAQRYEALQDYLHAGDRPACLLTATPRNNRVWDVYNQIKLFHADELTDLQVDPPNLKQFFKAVEDGSKRLQDILAPIMIRRTRRHVLRWWGRGEDNDTRLAEMSDAAAEPYLKGEARAYIDVQGEKQFFPRRHLKTLRYDIDATYRDVYDALRRRLERHSEDGSRNGEAMRFARYDLWHYLKPEKKDEPEFRDLYGSSLALTGLMRVLLFKRLESSVQAFRVTVGRMIRTQTAFRDAIADGMIPAGEAAEKILGQSGRFDDDELMGRLHDTDRRYHAGDFEVDRLIVDLDHDLDTLYFMLGAVEPITVEEDRKVWRLVEVLTSEPLNKQKALIFTQFTDTAIYLEEILRQKIDRPIDVVFGAGQDKGKVVGRFAPRANPELADERQPETEVLVSTDVLAEGLNLQDSNVVINYDLHWNPVRLIQRFGRIDRIGSEHEAIWAYNFMPDAELEKNLGIVARLKCRINEIHQTIGEDAKILDETEQLNEEAMFAIYREDASAVEKEEESETIDLAEAEELLRKLRADDPEEFRRIQNLPHGIRSTLRARQEGTVVLCEAEAYRQAFVRRGGEIRPIQPVECLQLLACEPEEQPAGPPPPDFNQSLQKVKRVFSERVQERTTERRHGQRLLKAQRYVIDELRALPQASGGGSDRQALTEMLIEAVSPAPSQALLRALRKLERNQVWGAALLHRVQELYGQHRLGHRSNHGPDDRQSDLPMIVCAEQLV